MRGLLALLLLAGLCAGGAAAATAPSSQPLVDFKHVSWSLEGGAPSRINTITQAMDGYIWVGSVDGLFRFDGVTFEPVPLDGAPATDRLVVAEVLGAHSGEVWVGLARSGGVAVYRDGRLTDAHMPHPSREVTGLAEDQEGGVWVARGGRKRDTLARYWHGRWQEIGGEAGLPEGEVWQILFARDGAMWVVLTDTILRRSPGAARFEATGTRTSRRASLAEDALGRIWVSDATGTRVLRESAAAGASRVRPYPHADPVGGTRVLFDRRGQLWGATWTDGVFHIAPTTDAKSGVAHVDTYKAANGLTSDQTHSLFEDREGNIWIGTELGLDMLRPAAVVVEPTIPANSPRGYLMAATGDGLVYVQDDKALYAIEPGKGAHLVRKTSWPYSLCAGVSNDVWLILRDTTVHVRGRRIETSSKPTEAMFGCAEDRQGRLWMPALEKGLYWRENGVWRRWPGFSATDGLPANAVTSPDGRAAVLFRSVSRLQSGPPVEPLFKGRFKIGGLEGVLPGRSALFVSGAQGMVRLQGGQAQTLDAQRYPWLASVNGLAQTPAGDTWIVGDAGIVRMPSEALDKVFAHPGASLPHQVFDFRDGLNSFAQKSPGPQAAVGGDGRVWFLTRRNVVRIDPAVLARNRMPPPVSIRALSVGDRRYRDPDDLKLDAGVTTLRIDYTALSLAVPSRVQFKYKLEGFDKDWVDAGDRRQALYSNLHPGAFRFRVQAANNDGVWNENGAAFGFTIPPTLYETWLFQVLCIVAFLVLLWGLYSLRLRQVAGQLRARVEERTAERERIARELHDTLLQSVQGLTMRFQSVADHIDEAHPAKAVINRALDRADQVLIEGRDRVRDLRRTDPRRLDVVLRELAFEQPFAATTRVEVSAEGIPRLVEMLVVEEIVRIGGEALFNAALHAQAKTVQVRISYSSAKLQLVFKDDGVGIGAKRLAWAAREGHYGLIGMQERAKKMGAQLSVESAPGAGVTIILTVNAGVAYPRRAWKGSRFLDTLWPMRRTP